MSKHIHIIMPAQHFTLTVFSAQNINIFFFESFIINTLPFYDHGCYHFFSLSLAQVFYWKLLFLRCENMRKFLTGFRSLFSEQCALSVRFAFFCSSLSVFKIIRSQIYVDVIKQWIMCFPDTPRAKNNNNIDQHAINNNSKRYFH